MKRLTAANSDACELDKPQPSIWVVIPTFNAVAVTRKCLSDLTSQTYRNLDVVLVDSGSTDGTCECIIDEFPRVHVVHGNSDWWWTKATNEGIRCALDRATSSDYIMTLNNDAILPEPYIAEMVRLATRYPRSIVGSIIYDSADRTRLVESGSYIDWRTMRYHYLSVNDLDGTGYSEKLTFLWGKGVLYPVRVFREIGLFDEDSLPHYGADYDFAASCKKRGYALRIQTKVPLYSIEDITAAGAQDVATMWEKVKLLFIRKSKLNLAVHLRVMFRHAPRRYWLSGSVFLTCRLLAHIFIKKGSSRGPVPSSDRQPILYDDKKGI